MDGVSRAKESLLEKYQHITGGTEEARIAINALHKSDAKETVKIRKLGRAEILLGVGAAKENVIAEILTALDDPKTASQRQDMFWKKAIEIANLKKTFDKAISFNEDDIESLKRKMLISVTANYDIVIMKIIEELQELRQVESLKEDERKKLVEKVKEVYSPIAHKLGIYSVSSEMNDLTLKAEDPETYEKIRNKIVETLGDTRAKTKKIMNEVEQELKKNNIKAKVEGREKTVYSTFNKILRKHVKIKDIHDLIAIRIITNSEKDCYEALGIIHTKWKPLLEEMDDYIAKPKENGYKALHTSLYYEDNTPFEIQIRTEEMNNFAEFGLAAHWSYKGRKKDSKYDKKIGWINQTLGWKKATGNILESDFFGKEIFAMTPKGDIIELPEGATVIDFAYAIHSDIGNKCMGAKINNNQVSINTKISNGDIIEIVTSRNQKPKTSWLAFAKTAKATQKIMTELNLKKTGGKDTGAKENQSVKTSNKKAKLAKCCSPLPGDDIVGIKTTKRKISIHRKDCKEIEKNKSNIVEVSWDQTAIQYDTRVIIHAEDRIGILKDILEVFSSNKIYVGSANAKIIQSNRVECVFVARFKDIKQFTDIKKKIEKVKGVSEVYRD